MRIFIFITGYRVYFRHRSGGIKMFYNYAKGISVYRDTPFDERFGRWLRAQNVEKWEEELLEKERSFIQGVVLVIPILAQYNDIKTLTTGENIYGTEADDLDYILSFTTVPLK